MRKSCFYGSIKFTARDNIYSPFLQGDEPENRLVRICLDRIAKQMRNTSECFLVQINMSQYGAGTVNINRSTNLLYDFPECNLFSEEFA